MSELGYRETPALIRGGGEELYGILTRPTGPANGVTVVHVNGKGPSASTVGRGRISVLLARALARRGFHGFRLDWRGSGESTGDEREWDLTELPVAELRAAVGWLTGEGLEDVVLVGTCGGARVALETAVVTDVRGVALLNMPVRDYDKDKRFESMPLRHVARRLLRRQTLRDLRDSQRRRRYLSRARRTARMLLSRLGRRSQPSAGGQFAWVGPGLLRALETLVDRGIPVLVFYGSDDDDYHDWQRASEGPLGQVVARVPGAVRSVVVSGRYYDRSSRQLTDELVAAIESELLPQVVAD